ncbi:CgeB family protein [Arsukibacterium sp.]|uniref:CgeB family protein n=1 Tax=Arsukibacterium sp. TaxID=1977258 RepID=UPI002FD9F6F1
MPKYSSPSTKVACILDEFSVASLQDNWQLCHLTPENYASQIDEFNPNFLFVESAWKGIAESWKNKIFNHPPELSAIVHYCHQQQIPTVFWNKEDPVHFDDFAFRAPIAQQFDYVFTTELDCIPRYKQILGHHRVYWLPFAANFRQHHPLQSTTRLPGLCFAGSYYAKYVTRCKDFELIVTEYQKQRLPITIYDRCAGTEDPNNIFPKKYHPHIKGALPFSQIDIAYKGYQTALTLNSAVAGQTMFARRIVELIACNTLVVSNYSRALRLLFGRELQMMTYEDPVMVATAISKDIEQKKIKLRLLRYVWQHYSSSVICDKVTQLVCGNAVTAQLPSVLVVGRAETALGKARVTQMFNLQRYPARELCWLEHANQADYVNYDFCCFFSEQHYYAEYYLSDLIMHSAIFPTAILTKSTRFLKANENDYHISRGKEYQEVDHYQEDCTLFPAQHFLAPKAKLTCIAVDIFNFCQDSTDNPANANITTTDQPMMAPMPQLLDAIAAEYDQLPSIVEQHFGANWGDWLGSVTTASDAITLDYDKHYQRLHIDSTLEPNAHIYLNSRQLIDVNTLTNPEKLKLMFKTVGLDNTLLDVWYVDEHQTLLRRSLFSPNKAIEDSIPENTTQIKFAIRIKGAGKVSIHYLGEGTTTLIPHLILPVSSTVIKCTEDTIRHEISQLHQKPVGSVEFFITTCDSQFRYSTFAGYDVIYGGEKVWASLQRGKQMMSKRSP